MFLFQRWSKKFLAVAGVLLVSSPAWAAGPPAANPIYNPLAILLFCIMIVLLIAIGILGGILTGASDVFLAKWKKRREEERSSAAGQAAAVFAGLMLISTTVLGQDKAANNTVQTVAAVGGLSPAVFYTMISIIFLELLVILVLLINVRLLIRSQSEKAIVAESKQAVDAVPRISWWSRFNKLRPIEQEADLDLGHDYDGIRELNNRLPPWWIYGFYATILFAAVYLWRYHVSHTAPLSKEEYELAVQRADQKTKDYLRLKGESVDENTVTQLGAADIAEGKRIFQISCISCHNEGGAGNVGPNLTDDYWIHGGDIKSVFKTIKYGFNAMPTWQNSYSNKQIAQLASYVKSLRGTHPANPKAPQGELYKEDASAPQAPVDSAVAKKGKKLAQN